MSSNISYDSTRGSDALALVPYRPREVDSSALDEIVKRSLDTQRADLIHLHGSSKVLDYPGGEEFLEALRNITILVNGPIRVHIEDGKLVPGRGSEYHYPKSLKSLASESLFLSKQVRILNASSYPILHSKQDFLRHLFYSVLPATSYDRSEISERSPLEFVLDPELYASHDDRRRDSVSKRKIHNTVCEIAFAYKLGIKPEKLKKGHDVRFMKDRGLKKHGVWKAQEFVTDPKEDRYGSCEIREAHLAEVASYQLDRLIGAQTVPATFLFKLQDRLGQRNGSLQFFVDAPLFEESLAINDPTPIPCGACAFFQPDHKILQRLLDNPENRGLNIPNLEDFAVTEILLGNNDAHYRNILREKESGNLVGIDKGNSFPWCHEKDLPSYKMRPNHSFKWMTLPQAQRPFSSSTVEKIRAISLKKVIALMERTLIDPTVPSSIEHFEGKVATMKDRVNLLKRLATSRYAIPMSLIAKRILHCSNPKSL